MAQCCDYRLAGATAKVVLHEVNLGLLPGAGGTQRLLRLTGLRTANDMITSGRPLGADDATLTTAMAVGKQMGKVCVLSGMCYELIGSRMLRHYGREAALCVM